MNCWFLWQEVEADFEGEIDFGEFFGGDGAATTEQARFFDGHDLFAFDVGVVGEAVFFVGGDTDMQGEFALGTAHGGDDG